MPTDSRSELKPTREPEADRSAGWPIYLATMGGCLAVMVLLLSPGYAAHLMIMLGIYLLLIYSANLVVGYGGLLTFCHAAFYGVGAYAYAILSIGQTPGVVVDDLILSAALSFPAATAAAVVIASVIALLTGLFVLRFRSDYFILATLSFQMMIFAVLYNFAGLTRGSLGIFGIPRPAIFGWLVTSRWEYLVVTGLVVLPCLGLLFLLYRSPFGLSLKGLREDEKGAESLGISAFRLHLSAFVIAACFAALAGVLFASYVTFIDPTSFGLQESILLVTALLLGGAGNRRGPLAGVLFMLLLPEFLRFLGLPSSMAANLRQIIFGGILIGLMYLRPQGLAGEFALK